jgi:hypothetical protein
LDVAHALAGVRAHPVGHLFGRALEGWWWRLGVAALDAADPIGKADEHGDRPLDRCWIRAGIAARGVDSVTQWPDPVRRVADIGEPGIPGLRMRHGDAQHPRPVRADHQGRTARPRPARDEFAVTCLVEASIEVDRALLKERADDRERFLEPIDAVIERDPERPKLGLVPAGAEPEDQTATTDLIDGRGLFGEDRGVVEGRASDERPELDPAGTGGDRGEHRPGFPWPTRRPFGPAVEQMLAEPHRVVAQVLDGPRHVEELGPACLALDLGQLDADLERTRHWRQQG